MSKTLKNLEYQLTFPKYSKDAKECILIYNYLKKIDGGKVWSNSWNVLVNCQIINGTKIYSPSKLGRIILIPLLDSKIYNSKIQESI